MKAAAAQSPVTTVQAGKADAEAISHGAVLIEQCCCHVQAFSLMKVRAVAYGRLRDLWAPLLMLILSAYAAVMGLHHLASSPRLL